MFHRLISLIKKELIQITRDRILLLFALLGPGIQLVMLGRAISTDIQDIPVAIIDYDLSPLSREIITALDNTTELEIVSYPPNLQVARNEIDKGQVMAIAVIPRDFMQDIQTPTTVPQIQVILDGSSFLIAGRALGATQGAVQSLIEDTVAFSANTAPEGITILSESLFNATLDFRPDAVTSQFALITFEITTLVAVMGIVREREIGTIEMLSITPLKRLELIAGKAITPLIIGVIDFMAMFMITQVVFDVPLRGSFLLLMGFTLLYLACEIGYALMISTIARSQQQAVTIIFVWVMIAMTLSGYMVPITTLPQIMQWVSWAVPLRHYLTIVRSIMLKGATFFSLLPSVSALLVLTITLIFLTTRTLSRAIE